MEETDLVCRILDVCRKPLLDIERNMVEWFTDDAWQNMHELACVSGIAAAYRLGADYIKFDNLAEDLFSKYLLVSHGVRYGAEQKRRQKRQQARNLPGDRAWCKGQEFRIGRKQE